MSNYLKSASFIYLPTKKLVNIVKTTVACACTKADYVIEHELPKVPPGSCQP